MRYPTTSVLYTILRSPPSHHLSACSGQPHSAGLAETGVDYSAGDGGGGPGNFASQLIVTDCSKAT